MPRNLLGRGKNEVFRWAVDLSNSKPLRRPVSSAMADSSDDATSQGLHDKQQTPWQPAHWQQHLENIRIMRSKQPAPVDTVGCDNKVCSNTQKNLNISKLPVNSTHNSRLHDRTAPLPLQRYQTLISLMLSSQTKDTTTAAAMERLKAHGLTPQNIMQSPESTLERLINPVSFYRRKAVYIKKSTAILLDQYNGDVPPTVEELMKLPGVGSKMAHLAVQAAWNKIEGIGVDTHVHRIANWLQWLPTPTKTPEATRTALESWLPRELWREINHLLVGFGQTICTPVRPRCDTCLNKDICPYFRKTHRGVWRKQSFQSTAATIAEEDAVAVDAVSTVDTKIYGPTEALAGQEITPPGGVISSGPDELLTVSLAKSKRKKTSDRVGKATKRLPPRSENAYAVEENVKPVGDIEDEVSPYFATSPLAKVKKSRSKRTKLSSKDHQVPEDHLKKAKNDLLQDSALNEAPTTSSRAARKIMKHATVTECAVEKVCDDPVLDSPAVKYNSAETTVVSRKSRKKNIDSSAGKIVERPGKR